MQHDIIHSKCLRNEEQPVLLRRLQEKAFSLPFLLNQYLSINCSHFTFIIKLRGSPSVLADFSKGLSFADNKMLYRTLACYIYSY